MKFLDSNASFGHDSLGSHYVCVINLQSGGT